MSSFFQNLCVFMNSVSTATFATGISASTRQANSAFQDYLTQSQQPNFRTCAEIDTLLTMPVTELHKAMHITPETQTQTQTQAQPEAANAQPEPEQQQP